MLFPNVIFLSEVLFYVKNNFDRSIEIKPEFCNVSCVLNFQCYIFVSVAFE